MPHERDARAYIEKSRPLRLDELNIKIDIHIVAYQDSAGFEPGVPRQTEVLAVDAGRGGESDSRVAPGILHLSARPFDLEYNVASHAMDAQLTCDREHSIFVFGDAIRFESQSGEFLHVEEVCALEVRVALCVAGVDGGGIDRNLSC